jgi:hypothetical protein
MVLTMRRTVLAAFGLLPCAAAPAQDSSWHRSLEGVPIAVAAAPTATVSTRTASSRFLSPAPQASEPTRSLRFGPPPPATRPADAGALAGRLGGNVRDFGVALDVVPAAPRSEARRRPEPRSHDEGLASGGLEFGSRLVWDFENGLNYSFNEHFTGLIGYGSLPGNDEADEGPDLGIDGAVVGVTFQF